MRRTYLLQNKILIAISILLGITACHDSKSNFSKSDVQNAQGLIGVSFSKHDLDTIYPYLQKNRAGYDSLRSHSIPIEVMPAIRFDPIPHGFELKPQGPPPVWTIPDSIELPKKNALNSPSIQFHN